MLIKPLDTASDYLPFPMRHVLSLLVVALGLAWIVFGVGGSEEKSILFQLAVSPARLSKNPLIKSAGEQPLSLWTVTKGAEQRWTAALTGGATEQQQEKKQLSATVVSASPVSIATASESIISSAPPAPIQKSLIPTDVQKAPLKKSLHQDIPVESTVLGAQHYTVQIASSANRSSMQTLMDQYIDLPLKVVSQDQEKYVLWYGDFSSRTAAEAAIQRLPARLLSSKPWIRLMRN